MSASITLAGLAWALPDGRQLFQNLDLQFGSERAGLIGRNGVGKSTLLGLIAGDLYPQAGSVVVVGRLGVLRQTVQVSGQETIADLFGVRAGLELLNLAQSGGASVEQLADADWTLESRMEAALARVGLHIPPDAPLALLSGGQRTRAGLAALVFADPDFLLLDEPTNNLDREGRAAVAALLAGWRAGAIVVSHDRELLETMDSIVELTPLGVTRYGGNWSHYDERKALEMAAAERDLADAEKRVALLARSAQESLERQDRRDRGGRKTAARGDMPKIVSGGLKNRAEGTRGLSARLTARRNAQADETAQAARQRLEIVHPFSVTVTSAALPAGKTVLRIDNVDAGYDSALPVLSEFSLHVAGPERIAITGPNGSGKTTLLSLVARRLEPFSGTVCVPVSFAMLDQNVSLLDPHTSIRDNFRRLNPDASENDCRAALARFMFRADAALQDVGSLSGGQLLRAGLSCVLGGPKPPQLLILDEPTNHLDLSSIETVEAGLSAYDGALVVVSHDETFLANIGIMRRIAIGADSGPGEEI